MIRLYLVITSKRLRTEKILNEYKKLTLRNGRYTKYQLLMKEQFYKEFMEL